MEKHVINALIALVIIGWVAFWIFLGVYIVAALQGFAALFYLLTEIDKLAPTQRIKG